MKKLLLSTIVTLFISQINYGQGQTCPFPEFCNPPCAAICNIINDTDCELNFIWGYQGSPCADQEYPAGTVGPNNAYFTPPLPWQAPCMKFCDDPCECPTMFRVIDPNTMQPADPWGGAIFTCCWSGTYYDIFHTGSCTTPVHVTVTVINGCVTFHFHY
ncbi:MAG: hypothetical protein LC109_11985 [Bacteroidia bacterium]|nr:hypothetical protein [Bacteroidia bacterium]MCO5253310.1 hypothetical protein [Bacteroidota bacterium]MCZ2130967.1 hypothetical protein [Bacteroidia bacterium]